MSMFRKALGKTGEDLAASYLKDLGYTLIKRNYRIRGGEIDIIAEQGQTLVFIEVKTRSSMQFGGPLEAVGPAKQKQIIYTAQHYLQQNDLFNRDIRFDVLGILIPANTPPQFELVPNAFQLW